MAPRIVLLFLFAFLSLLSLPSFVEAYSISPITGAHITEINANHFLTEGGNATTQIAFGIKRDENSLDDPLSFNFFPKEHLNMDPVVNFSVVYCEGDNPPFGGWGFDLSPGCSNPIEPTLTRIPRVLNFFDYQIILNHRTIDPNYKTKDFRVHISYVTPRFTFPQGEYSVAWLNFQNMRGSNLINTIILPTENDIPRFIPDADETLRVPYINWLGELQFTWAFTFNGNRDRIIWYWNEEQRRISDTKRDNDNVWKGVRWGLVIGIISSIITSLFVIFLVDWTPLGNRFLKWAAKTFTSNYRYGNKNTKKYHTSDCPYLDNIDKLNKETFKNEDEAKAQGYTSCEVCFPTKSLK